MSVNGVTSSTAVSAYSYTSTSASTAKENTAAKTTASTPAAEETGVVYEPSNESQTVKAVKKYTL